MKKALFVFAAVATMLASCQLAEKVAPMGESKVFEGTIEVDDATRVSLAMGVDEHLVNWVAEDQISVNGVAYKATDGGDIKAHFEKADAGAADPASPYTAYYPVEAATAFPAVQNYVEGGISCIPMMATSETTELPFKNLGAILKLNVTTPSAETVKSITLAADQPLSGAFTVVDNAAVISDGTAGITLDCGKGAEVGTTPVPFFVSVPAGSYTNLAITLTTTDGKSQTRTLKNGKTLVIERSNLYQTDFAFNDLKAAAGLGGVAILPDGPEFNSALKSLVTPESTHTTVDNTVTKIVFETMSASTDGTEIQNEDSDKPIYASLDGGVITITTPAETIKTSADASYLFGRFTNLEEIVNLTCLDTQDAEVMNNMFWYDGCDTSMLRTLDLSNFNTSNVSTFRSMFCNCNSLETLDVSSFDTSNAETFEHMFRAMTLLKSIDLTNFNTENVTNFASMFYLDLNLSDVKLGFNTESATTLASMFYKCWGLTEIDLSSFNTENVTTFASMFFWCRNLTELDLSNFDTSSTTTFSNMFNSCYSLKKLDFSAASIGAIPVKSAMSGFEYMLQQCGALEEVRFGDGFRAESTSYLPVSTMWLGAASQAVSKNRTATCNTTGTLYVYCCQDVADWLAYSALRWINTGHSTYEKPVPVHFIDPTTNTELSVVWRAN